MDSKYKPNFEIPNQQTIDMAIGDLSYLQSNEIEILKVLQRHSNVIGKPKSGDWLTEHKEYGQRFDKFLKEFVVANTTKKFMYIVPLDKEIGKDFLEMLRIVSEAFYFGFRVKVMDYPDISKWNIESRINPNTNQLQYNASQLLDKLLYIKPRDAYSVIAVTMIDLYPDQQWNYVFGLADKYSQMGVFSFARYNDCFYDPQGISDPQKIFYRSCKVMCHEFGHQYGMKHCIYYSCLMNGSNNLEENERKPFDFCPVCLKKLHYVLKFNMLNRYQALQEVYQKIGGQFFKKEAELMQNLINDIQQLQTKEIKKN